MNYTIEKTQNAPAYLLLYRLLRDDIINEIYPYNGKLPSKRTLAAETGLSTVTVEHSYLLLCEEGYIESRERSGYYVTFRKEECFMSSPRNKEVQRSYAPHTSVHSPDFPFSVLAKTMRSVISDLGESILDRSPNSGCPELRDAIRLYLARSRGITASVNQIIIGSGSEYLYSLIVNLLGRERIYALESPSYKKIRQVYGACGVPHRMLPLENDGINSHALQSCDADVLHISPYRSYPSGITATASKRHEYLRWASEKGRYIVEDDFESEFTVSKKTEETLFSHTEKDNVIYMNTFSKTISPSLRVAYMVLPKHLISVFEDKLGFYSCTVPTYVQYVLAELISSGIFERHINRVRRNKRKGIT